MKEEKEDQKKLLCPKACALNQLYDNRYTLIL